MDRIVCIDGIQCPEFEYNPCCYNCPKYDSCDFEDKCELTPCTCGNNDYMAIQKESRK